MEVLVKPRARQLTRTLRSMIDGDSRGPLAVVADPARLSSLTQSLDLVDVVLATSGSTDGTGHLVGLNFEALIASARATYARIGGPGQWIAALPADHVAGFQVAFRSALAGTEPIELERWDDLDALRSALDVAKRPVYASLVPAQLRRLVESAPGVLARLDALLVGGAALSAQVREGAETAGIRVVRTYGMTETCGGCVYDGVPLAGVSVRIVDGLVQLSGDTLMTRYLDSETQPFVDSDAARWLTTSDLGHWRADGRLSVTGRADDVIISGGVNVVPRPIEERLEAAIGGAWAVIGVPDAQWGERVVAVTDAPHITFDLVSEATSTLDPAQRPRELISAPLPRTPLGKLDRRTLRERIRRIGDHGHHR